MIRFPTACLLPDESTVCYCTAGKRISDLSYSFNTASSPSYKMYFLTLTTEALHFLQHGSFALLQHKHFRPTFQTLARQTQTFHTLTAYTYYPFHALTFHFTLVQRRTFTLLQHMPFYTLIAHTMPFYTLTTQAIQLLTTYHSTPLPILLSYNVPFYTLTHFTFLQRTILHPYPFYFLTHFTLLQHGTFTLLQHILFDILTTHTILHSYNTCFFTF